MSPGTRGFWSFLGRGVSVFLGGTLEFMANVMGVVFIVIVCVKGVTKETICFEGCCILRHIHCQCLHCKAQGPRF